MVFTRKQLLLTGRTLTYFAVGVLGILLMTGCTVPWRHASASSVNNINAPRPTAQHLLATLTKNFKAVNSFHVIMQVDNAGPVSDNQVQIRTANGDVVMPDKIKAQATVIMSGQAMTVNFVSVADNQFITDPITGQWRVIKGVLDPRTLTNPDTGVISLVSKVQNASQPVSDHVNGISCWRIKGQLDAKYLAFFTGGGVPAGTMLQTSACIGKGDSLPYQLIVTGQAASGDTAQTTRTFNMSNYNETISIATPQI